MPPSTNRASTNLTKLAHALGFTDYPEDKTAEPYLSYILKQHAGSEGEEDYVELFVKIVKHFQTTANGTMTVATVQSIIDELFLTGFRGFFANTAVGDGKELVEDAVVCILGTWATMLSSFQNKRQCRKVVAAYCIFAEETRTHNAALMMKPGTTTGTTAGATGTTGTTGTVPVTGTTGTVPVTGTTGTVPVTSSATPAPYSHSLSDLIAHSGLLPGGKWDQRVDVVGDATTKFVSLMLNTSNIQNQNSLQHLFATTPGQALPHAMSSYAMLDDLGVQESLSISAKRLNAFTLNVLSGVDVQWTPNVSRHLLLTNVGGRHVLELFSLPCAFDSITSPAVGISWELKQEIEDSYAMLFNSWYMKPLHVKLGAFIGIRRVCWCRLCCAYRYRKRCIRACRSRGPATSLRRINNAANPIHSDFDPVLENLMMKHSMSDWTPESFPSLWPRIARLEKHLQSSRPWSLWVLFRDRRDTLQFWTFLFGTLILFLTVMQVFLSIAQVVGSFK